MTADLARLLQGTLLTRDFLADGIKGQDEYASISDAELKAARERLSAIFLKFPLTQSPSESQTEDDLIWPVLKELGWGSSLRQQNLSVKGREDVPDGILFADDAAKTKANAHDEEWKRYALGLAVVESKRWQRPLDRRSPRKGEETTPSTQMLRYLRRVDVVTDGVLRWGILTNGAKWRLYFQGAKSVSEEFCEIDLQVALGLAADSGGLFDLSDHQLNHWLRVFVLIFRQTSFLPSKKTKLTFLQRALDEGRYYEERVAKSLADLVFDKAFPALVGGIAKAAPKADLQDVRTAALVLLYRLLFLLYAEDRDLLPVRDKRFDDYSLRERVRQDVGRRKAANDTFSETATKIWSAIDDLSRAIDKGDGSIGLPPYNGGLFDATRTPLLADVRLADAVLADVVDVLSFDHSGPSRRYINYRDLSVQQLGSIYERLLEFELARAGDGGVEVQPNIFARKRSGSYYTPEELVRVILDETLKPLIADKMKTFKDRCDQLAVKTTADVIGELEPFDPAEALLELRICDPAMGSGHFLVSLVDTLTDHVINAIAEAAEVVKAVELIEDGEHPYESPLIKRIEEIRRRIVRNAEQNGWGIHLSQLDDRHIIRRMILKRCIYGVDKNPMAVELAKVSLWLHTFTVGAPLSFLDHHLRCGDSLFGLSVNGVIARITNPKIWGGKKGGMSLLINEPLKKAMSSAAQMQTIERLTDAEIAEAHRSAQIWDGVVSMVQPLDAFMRLLHALDWLEIRENGEKTAVKAFLDGIFGDPFEIARGKVEIDVTKPKAAEFLGIFDRAQALIGDERFLNWQTAFPGVWEGWESEQPTGGFDAVIGNPPWDRMKMQEVEWFAARRQEIALATRADDRKSMIAALKKAGDSLYTDYERAVKHADDSLRIARSNGDYPLLSGGDLNIYSLFVERAARLVKPDGIVGLLTPSGIASDKTASPFFRSVSTTGRLCALYDVENRQGFFPDVDSRFKFCVLVFGGEGRTFPIASCAFYLQRMEDLSASRFAMRPNDFQRVNPNTGTAPVFRTPNDAALTLKIYDATPAVVDRSSGSEAKSWPIRYQTMFHMTNDSRLFRTIAELEEKEGAYRIHATRWRSKQGDWVPLYEGKMIQAFDHRAASVVVNAANRHRPGQPQPATGQEHEDPNWSPNPQYWVPESECRATRGKGWVLGFKEISSPTNARTMIAALLPAYGFGNKVPLLTLEDGARDEPLLVANLNAVPFDFVTRQKLHGQTLNWFIVEQLPFIPRERYGQTIGGRRIDSIVREAVLELSYTAHDMAPFAIDMNHTLKDGDVKPPYSWDQARRLSLRAKLDALYFRLYGITDRDDVRYIYSTFPIIKKEERAALGAYRSCELCLSYLNAFAADDPNYEAAA